MSKPGSVDDYISGCPKELRVKLACLRRIIKDAVPKAEEKISYGMPYYGYKGRLAYFRLSRDHIGLYIPPPVIAEHKQELQEYKTAVSTVRFPLKKDLPEELIKKLVQARARKNEEAVQKQNL